MHHKHEQKAFAKEEEHEHHKMPMDHNAPMGHAGMIIMP